MGTDSEANKKTFSQRLSRDFKLNKYKYLLIIPVLVYLALFCYKPMYGLIIAFKNYKPTRGIWGSQWVGFMRFETLFKDIFFWQTAAQYVHTQRAKRRVWFPRAYYTGVAAQRGSQREVQAHRTDDHVYALFHIAGRDALADQDLLSGKRSVFSDR